MEGRMAAWRIKSKPSIHPSIHPVSLPPAFHDFFLPPRKTHAAPPPPSAGSVSLPVPGTRASLPIHKSLSPLFFLSVGGLLCMGWNNWDSINEFITQRVTPVAILSPSFITPSGQLFQVSVPLHFDLPHLLISDQKHIP